MHYPTTPHTSFRQLKVQAKELLKAWLHGESLERTNVLRELQGQTHFRLAHAQLAIAREAGYSSWARLKVAVEETAATSVTLSANELAGQSLTELTAATLRQTFERQGYVVLKNVFDRARISAAREDCERTAYRRNKLRVPVPYELIWRWPLKGIVRNSIAWTALNEVLQGTPASRDFCWYRISPPDGRSVAQLHKDRIDPSLSVSVDVPLSPFNTETGATELWPGSQHEPIRNPALIPGLRRQIAQNPHTQVTADVGDVILRDERAWHRGGRNRTNSNRCLLSSPGWCLARAKSSGPKVTGQK